MPAGEVTSQVDDRESVQAGEEIRVLRYDLNVPAECSFRKAGSVNGLPTYQVPPLTTIRGMLYNALGRPSLLQQYHYSSRTQPKEQVDAECDFRAEFEDRTAIGLRIIEPGIETTHFRSTFKRNEKDRESDDPDDHATYNRAIANCDTLIQPTFRVYLADFGEKGTDAAEGDDASLLDTLRERLLDPARPLYLGRSDDLVIVENLEILRAERVVLSDLTTLNCVMPGGEGESIEMLPIKTETISGHTSSAAQSRTVSIDGGLASKFYNPDDSDEPFVFIDPLKGSV